MSELGRRSTAFWARLSEPQTAASILILYCAVHFILRLGLSPNFTGDESEEMLFGQALQWSYPFHHPPLIGWLSWAVQQVPGSNRMAFLVLQYVLMGLGLLAFFGAARLVIRDTLLAALASFALLTTFSMGYFPLIGSMHAVLLATMLALYMWADARVLARGNYFDHLVLGVVAGLGILSEYVFLILPIALGIAVALTPYFRARLKIVPLMGTVLVAAAIVAPAAMWGHDPSLFGFAQTGPHNAGPLFDPVGWAESAGALVVAMVIFAVPAALLFPVLYWPACKPLGALAASEEDRAWLRVYEIAIVAGAAITLVAILFAGTETLKGRWLHQVMLPLPIYAFLRVKVAGTGDRVNKIFAAGALAFALAAAAASVIVYETHADRCKACDAYWPMPRYAEAFRQSGFQRGTILATTPDLAGNLRYEFPDSRVLTPAYPPAAFGPDPGGQCLVVWEGLGEPPKDALTYLSGPLGAKITNNAMRGNVDAKLTTAKKHFDAMSFMLLPPGSCHGT